MALLLSFRRAAAAAALAGLALWGLASERGTRARGAAAVVDAEQARALCAAEGFSEREFWARAEAMGVGGALLRSETLEPFLRSGEVNRFSPGEIEKLRATGVASPGAPLEPGALWVRDEALWERLRLGAAAAGLAVETRRYGEMRVVTLPRGAVPGELAIGFEPARTAALRQAGLTPVFLARARAELALAPAEPDAVLLLGGGFPAEALVAPDSRLSGTAPDALRLAFADGPEGGALGRASRALRRRALAAFPAAAPRALTAGELPPGAGPAAAYGLAYGRGDGLLLLSLDPAAGAEGNLAALRELLRRLRERGWDTRLTRPAEEPRSPAARESALRLALGLALLALGPILALRWAAAALRALRARAPAPQASPVLELFGGAAAAAAVAAAAGLAARAALAFPGRRLGAWPDLSAWAAAATMLLAALALYASDLGALLRRRFAPAGGLGAALAAFAVALLLFPPDGLAAWGPAAWLEPLGRRAPSCWWAAARWREWLAGYPCLAVGLGVYLRRLGERRAPLSPELDPRPWLLVGMFAPAGACAALAAGRAPLGAALLHSAAAAGAGSALGLLLLSLLPRRASR